MHRLTNVEKYVNRTIHQALEFCPETLSFKWINVAGQDMQIEFVLMESNGYIEDCHSYCRDVFCSSNRMLIAKDIKELRAIYRWFAGHRNWKKGDNHV